MFDSLFQKQLSRDRRPVLPVHPPEHLPPAVRQARGRPLRHPAVHLAATTAAAAPAALVPVRPPELRHPVPRLNLPEPDLRPAAAAAELLAPVGDERRLRADQQLANGHHRPVRHRVAGSVAVAHPERLPWCPDADAGDDHPGWLWERCEAQHRGEPARPYDFVDSTMIDLTCRLFIRARECRGIRSSVDFCIGEGHSSNCFEIFYYFVVGWELMILLCWFMSVRRRIILLDQCIVIGLVL